MSGVPPGPDRRTGAGARRPSAGPDRRRPARRNARPRGHPAPGGRLRPRPVGDRGQPQPLRWREVIVLADLDEATDEAQLDTLDYLAAPQPDVTLIGIHRGGQKAKKVLDTFKKSGARVIDAPAIKSDRDKVDFAMNEFQAVAARRAKAVQASSTRWAATSANSPPRASSSSPTPRAPSTSPSSPGITAARSRATGFRSRTPRSRVAPVTPWLSCGTPSPSASTRCRSWPTSRPRCAN